MHIVIGIIIYLAFGCVMVGINCHEGKELDGLDIAICVFGWLALLLMALGMWITELINKGE